MIVAREPMSDWRDAIPAPWTAPQRRGLLALLGLGTLALAAVALTRPTFVADPPPADAPRAADLADRIDPNGADVGALAALPTLGPGRAAAIVAYREKVAERDGTPVVFRAAADLMRVKGIGPRDGRGGRALPCVPRRLRNPLARRPALAAVLLGRRADGGAEHAGEGRAALEAQLGHDLLGPAPSSSAGGGTPRGPSSARRTGAGWCRTRGRTGGSGARGSGREGGRARRR